MKYRAKSVDNTDHLLLPSSPKNVTNATSTSTPSSDRRYKMKPLSTSPNRWQPLTVNVDSNVGLARRRLSKRPSLDSGIVLGILGKAKEDSVESEPRKPTRSVKLKTCA